MVLPLKVAGNLAAKDMEKAEVLDAFFAAVSIGKDCLKPPRSSEPVSGSGRLKNYPQQKTQVEAN